MASGSSDKMSGVVDPETIYTKQNCIGMLWKGSLYGKLLTFVGGGSFGKVYKGYVAAGNFWHS